MSVHVQSVVETSLGDIDPMVEVITLPHPFLEESRWIPGIPGNGSGFLTRNPDPMEPQIYLGFFLVDSLWIPGPFLASSLVHRELIRNIPWDSTKNPGNHRE